MTNLSSLTIEGKMNTTVPAAPTAAEVRRGKRAYADGNKIVGTAEMKTLNEQGAIILLMQNPTGVPTASYQPVTNASVPFIIKSDRILDLSNSAAFDLNTNGYAYDSSSFSLLSLFYNGKTPARTGGVRKHEMWGMTKNAALTTNQGVRLYWNVLTFAGGGAAKFWYIDLYWNGSVFKFDVWEYNGTTSTARGTTSFSSTIDEPIVWHITLYEQGNSIIAQCFIYESDAITDGAGTSLTYTGAPRNYKTYMGAGIGVLNTPGDQWLIRGWQISDILL